VLEEEASAMLYDRCMEKLLEEMFLEERVSKDSCAQVEDHVVSNLVNEQVTIGTVYQSVLDDRIYDEILDELTDSLIT